MKYTALLGLALAAVALANPMPTKKKGNSGNSGDAGDAGNASNAGTAGTAGNASGAAGAGSTASTAAGANPAAAQQVTASIDKWLQDIQAVNNFVDTAGSLQSAQEISAAASTAFVAAQDEGTQNDALQKLVQLDASGLSAAQDLQNQFKIIGPAINDTISNPQNVQKNIAAINGARYVPYSLPPPGSSPPSRDEY